MDKFCVVEGMELCPCCRGVLNLVDNECENCGSKIRVINRKRVSEDFLRNIIKYDIYGNYIEKYENVYECFPIDTKKSIRKGPM